jgi:hypothetical protein
MPPCQAARLLQLIVPSFILRSLLSRSKLNRQPRAVRLRFRSPIGDFVQIVYALRDSSRIGVRRVPTKGHSSSLSSVESLSTGVATCEHAGHIASNQRRRPRTHCSRELPARTGSGTTPSCCSLPSWSASYHVFRYLVLYAERVKPLQRYSLFCLPTIK